MSTKDVVIKPLPFALGATIECGDVSRLDAAAQALIRQAYLDHLVLVFPGQHLSDDEQIAFTSLFGPVTDSYTGLADGKRRMVAMVSNQPGGGLGFGELRWHSDHSFEARPFSASILQAIAIPPSGGDTHYSNMYLALDTLPDGLKAKIRGLTIKNAISTNSAGEQIGEAITDVRLHKGPSHPIIRTHPETGRNALYLGRRPDAYINGLSLEESEDLLNALWAHASNGDFAYPHRWQVGDVVVWDNRATMHRRDAFDETQTRILHRTQCSGDEPTHDAAADARGSHARGHLSR
ncbi:TauD/TfdA family dioxygenase [Novosphingobium sp. SG707]|uniref:TauD/TfdA dioxygenase family protein n=1 Tax=Novosphingobium sp. SG707 TaxID=2586996 RepID=UPI00179BF033|nr:TauD/TfdA family dioxygenase [Novosphingobium sp. SG707]NKJ00960.1 taurine dioxygenase [Novosphingobium sp. SG707]